MEYTRRYLFHNFHIDNSQTPQKKTLARSCHLETSPTSVCDLDCAMQMRPLLAKAFPRISQILLPLKIRSHQRFLITNATCGRGFRGTESPWEAQTFSTSTISVSIHLLEGGSWGNIPLDLRWVPLRLRWIAPWPVSNCVGIVNCLGGFDSATDCWEAVSFSRNVRDSGRGFGSALDVCASVLAANLAERLSFSFLISPELFGNSRVDTGAPRKSGDTPFDLFGWGCMSWGISSVMTSMLHGLRLRGQLGCLSLSLEIALSSSSWSEVSTILRRAASLPPLMAPKGLPPCSDRVPFSFPLVGF